MSEITGTPDILTPATTRVAPGRLAWGVLLLAFALFCLICIVSTLGVHYFLFRDSVPMESALKVGRGTVAVITRTDPIEQSVRGERALSSATRVSTDGQSQAVIGFRDSERLGRMVAAVTVKPNTSVRLDSAAQGRFDWSTPVYFYDVRLSDLSGEVDVFVTEGLSRNVRLLVASSQGSWVSLLKSGRYIVNATDTQLRVITREGQAVLCAVECQVNRAIPEATQGVYINGASEIALSAAYVDLLENSSFEDIQAPENNGPGESTQILPKRWGCTNEGETPRGAYRSEMFDGRVVLRLVRAEGASTHGETRCVQVFPPDGIDLTAYSYLTLRASFYVKYQSLSACGFEASECPLMLKINYHDMNGNPQQWYHGFYAWTDPQYSDWPLQCNSCAQQHESIYSAAWYTYDSGNLFTLFPPPETPDTPDKRPARIDEIWFYASGHQYDVYISEISLLAGQTETPIQP